MFNFRPGRFTPPGETNPVPIQNWACYGLQPVWIVFEVTKISCVCRDSNRGPSSLWRQSNPITGLDRPLGFQEVEVPRISRQSAHEDGKVVSPTHRPPLPPGDIPGTRFC